MDRTVQLCTTDNKGGQPVLREIYWPIQQKVWSSDRSGLRCNQNDGGAISLKETKSAEQDYPGISYAHIHIHLLTSSILL